MSIKTSISSHHRSKRYHFPLATYDSEHFGPLFAVSDEGSAGETIVNAAYASAKAKALWPIDPVSLGVALDGERMTSAGEVPIGPPEYEDLSDAAAGRLLLTTNIGVRVNTRLTQQLPEFALLTSEVCPRKFAGAMIRSLPAVSDEFVSAGAIAIEKKSL
jgi:hypothetical protein